MEEIIGKYFQVYVGQMLKTTFESMNLTDSMFEHDDNESWTELLVQIVFPFVNEFIRKHITRDFFRQIYVDGKPLVGPNSGYILNESLSVGVGLALASVKVQMQDIFISNFEIGFGQGGGVEINNSDGYNTLSLKNLKVSCTQLLIPIKVEYTIAGSCPSITSAFKVTDISTSADVDLTLRCCSSNTGNTLSVLENITTQVKRDKSSFRIDTNMANEILWQCPSVACIPFFDNNCHPLCGTACSAAAALSFFSNNFDFIPDLTWTFVEKGINALKINNIQLPVSCSNKSLVYCTAPDKWIEKSTEITKGDNRECEKNNLFWTQQKSNSNIFWKPELMRTNRTDLECPDVCYCTSNNQLKSIPNSCSVDKVFSPIIGEVEKGCTFNFIDRDFKDFGFKFTDIINDVFNILSSGWSNIFRNVRINTPSVQGDFGYLRFKDLPQETIQYEYSDVKEEISFTIASVKNLNSVVFPDLINDATHCDISVSKDPERIFVYIRGLEFSSDGTIDIDLTLAINSTKGSQSIVWKDSCVPDNKSDGNHFYQRLAGGCDWKTNDCAQGYSCYSRTDGEYSSGQSIENETTYDILTAQILNPKVQADILLEITLCDFFDITKPCKITNLFIDNILVNNLDIQSIKCKYPSPTINIVQEKRAKFFESETSKPLIQGAFVETWNNYVRELLEDNINQEIFQGLFSDGVGFEIPDYKPIYPVKAILQEIFIRRVDDKDNSDLDICERDGCKTRKYCVSKPDFCS